MRMISSKRPAPIENEIPKAPIPALQILYSISWQMFTGRLHVENAFPGRTDAHDQVRCVVAALVALLLDDVAARQGSEAIHQFFMAVVLHDDLQAGDVIDFEDGHILQGLMRRQPCNDTALRFKEFFDHLLRGSHQRSGNTTLPAFVRQGWPAAVKDPIRDQTGTLFRRRIRLIRVEPTKNSCPASPLRKTVPTKGVSR